MGTDGIRTGQVGQQGQIAARYRGADLTGPVESVWGAGIAKIFPFQRQAEGLHIGSFCPTLIKRGGHRRMQGGDPESCLKMRMKQRDIAVADDPFRAFAEACKVDAVDDPAKPIAAATAKDGFHVRVVQRLLQIGQPGLIGA